MNELYEVTKFVDHPMFEGFGLDPDAYPSKFGHDSLLDDMVPGYGDSSRDPNWMPRSLLTNWSAPAVEGRVEPFNDYPCINLTHPVFSSRAVEALRDLLEPNGELTRRSCSHGSRMSWMPSCLHRVWILRILDDTRAETRFKTKCDCF